MKLEREQLGSMTPILEVETPVEIDSRYIDDYGKHLNQSLALKLFEEARTHFLEQRGVTPQHTMSNYGALGFVVKQDARYKSQVFEGEELQIVSKVYITGARFVFHQVLMRGSDAAIDALIEVAMVNEQGRAVRIPQGLLDELKP